MSSILPGSTPSPPEPSLNRDAGLTPDRASFAEVLTVEVSFLRLQELAQQRLNADAEGDTPIELSSLSLAQQAILMESAFARYLREECCNALERHIAGEVYSPERPILAKEHREGLSAAIHEIGSNVVLYNCFGFDSMIKRDIVEGSVPASILEPYFAHAQDGTQPTIHLEYSPGTILLRASNLQNLPEDLATRFYEAIKAPSENTEADTPSPDSLDTMSAEELEAFLSGSTAFDLGGRGFKMIAIAFPIITCAPQNITFTCSLEDYLPNQLQATTAA